MNTILNAWENKHTSTAAIAFFLLAVAGVIWPQHKDKFNEIQTLAVVYGLFQAGDAAAGKQRIEDLKTEIQKGTNDGK